MSAVELLALTVAGFAASYHCVAMCGVFALAAGGGKTKGVRLTLYSAGRLASYVFLGTLVGAFGAGVRALIPLTPIQIALSLLTGLAIVLVGAQLAGFLRLDAIFFPQFYASLVPALRAALSFQDPSQVLLLGLLNGLLPCPIVYAFLTRALMVNSAVEGGIVMFAFGIGTLPALVLTGLARAWVKRVTAQFARPAGIALIAFGIITALRFLLETSLPAPVH